MTAPEYAPWQRWLDKAIGVAVVAYAVDDDWRVHVISPHQIREGLELSTDDIVFTLFKDELGRHPTAIDLVEAVLREAWNTVKILEGNLHAK